jgi:DNA replication protein DnaC
VKRACKRCGAELELRVPPGEVNGAFTRSLAEIAVLCDSCADEIEGSQAGEQKRAELKARVTVSGLPKRLRGVDFTGHGSVAASARDWARMADPGGLLLHGPVGVGKTYLAAAACWERLQWASCRWVSVAKLLTQLRSAFDDEERAKAAKLVAGVQAAVLDDLDKVNPSDYGREVIFTAIDGRIEAEAPLLITTNLAPSALGERFGEAVMSRLVGYCRVIEMAGEDRRLERVG